MCCPHDKSVMAYHMVGDVEFYVCRTCGKVVLVNEQPMMEEDL